MFVTTFATVEDETGTVIKSKSKKVVEEKGVIVEEQLSDDDFHSAEEDNGHVQIEEVPDDEFVIGKLSVIHFSFIIYSLSPIYIPVKTI